jgi:hypothetical protein
MTRALIRPLRIFGETQWCRYQLEIVNSSDDITITDTKTGEVIGRGHAVGLFPMDAGSPELAEHGLIIESGRVVDDDQFTAEELQATTDKIEEERRQLQKPRVSWPQAMQRIARGVAGLAKATLGIDASQNEVVLARLQICEPCEHSRPQARPVKDRQCGHLFDTTGKTCGCWIGKKTMVAGEQCPLSKW